MAQRRVWRNGAAADDPDHGERPYRDPRAELPPGDDGRQAGSMRSPFSAFSAACVAWAARGATAGFLTVPVLGPRDALR
jgi:hypothetical protein